MFVASYIIVNWGPHGMWLSNCSDDINSTICDYATQVAWKVTKSTVEHFHDKGLLGWLEGGIAPPGPESSSVNRLGLNNGISRNSLRAPKNLELGLDISQGPVVVIVIIPFIIIIHISYRLMFPFLLLQPYRTYSSVTCIDCKLYTCLNSSVSIKNKSLWFFDLDVICGCQ